MRPKPIRAAIGVLANGKGTPMDGAHREAGRVEPRRHEVQLETIAVGIAEDPGILEEPVGHALSGGAGLPPERRPPVVNLILVWVGFTIVRTWELRVMRSAVAARPHLLHGSATPHSIDVPDAAMMLQPSVRAARIRVNGGEYAGWDRV